MANSNFSALVVEAGLAADQENVANVSLPISAKGTGVVFNSTNTPFFKATPTAVATAGDVTYTVAQLKLGFILRDPAGAGRADLFPTAAALVAALPDAPADTCFEVEIRNTADAAETITMTTNTGLTLSGTMTIAQNNQKRFLVRLTDVAVGSEAATIYSMGTVVF